jgi:hypothetical protein
LFGQIGVGEIRVREEGSVGGRGREEGRVWGNRREEGRCRGRGGEEMRDWSDNMRVHLNENVRSIIMISRMWQISGLIIVGSSPLPPLPCPHQL